MNQTEQSSTDSFTQFSERPAVTDAPRRHTGNVLKEGTFQRLELDTLNASVVVSSSGEPRVIVNRSGDMLESIEFICTCGCSKTVSFDYEGE